MSDGVYRRWLDELWNGPLDELEQIAARVVTPDFVGHWPLRPGFVHGPDELAKTVRMGREMFDELTFTAEVGPLVDGDLVAARWVGRGRIEGRDIEFRGHDILRVSGDRFGEYWVLSEDVSGQLAR